MKILIDNGHGDPPLTGGKCSPDKRLLEYYYAREIAQRVSRGLSLRGHDAILITPETTDISINERVRRANAWCRRLGSKNVLLVSIHVDAAKSDGKWHDARGCSARVSLNASESSKRMARIYTELAIERGLIGNRCVPPGKYWPQNLGICRDTLCPAVLTENGFQDNKEDVAFLLSEEGKDAIAQLHIDAIDKYVRTV